MKVGLPPQNGKLETNFIFINLRASGDNVQNMGTLVGLANPTFVGQQHHSAQNFTRKSPAEDERLVLLKWGRPTQLWGHLATWFAPTDMGFLLEDNTGPTSHWAGRPTYMWAPS